MKSPCHPVHPVEGKDVESIHLVYGFLKVLPIRVDRVEQTNARFFDTTAMLMSFAIGDKQAFESWQAAQHLDDDESEPIEHPVHALDPETVRALVMLVLPPQDTVGTHRRFVLAFKRFLILAGLIDDSLAAKGLDHIAKILTQVGMPTSRASLSQLQCALADTVGIHRLGRSDAGREAYRQRAVAVWNRKRTTNETAAP